MNNKVGGIFILVMAAITMLFCFLEITDDEKAEPSEHTPYEYMQ